jgi:hypothetical protein
MKRERFFAKIEKMETEWADYTYSRCESVHDRLNWKTYHQKLLDTTRVFFFSKTNTVVLYDKPNGYKEHFKNPSLALKEIRGWLGTYYNQDAVQDLEEEENRREEEAWQEEMKEAQG